MKEKYEFQVNEHCSLALGGEENPQVSCKYAFSYSTLCTPYSNNNSMVIDSIGHG
jgi:hypothetical protein